MSPKSVCICVPAYAGIHPCTVATILATIVDLSRRDILAHYTWCQSPLLAQGRALLVADFLATGMSHALFIDSDVWFAPDVAYRLLASERDFVAVAACTRVPPHTWCVRIPPASLASAAPNGLLRVDGVGFGCTLISRGAVERIHRANADLEFAVPPNQTTVHAVFDPLPQIDLETGRMVQLGEDYSFCARARAVGVEILVDPNVEISHAGHRARLADSLPQAVDGPSQLPKGESN